ncbi:hypothetical protein IPM65_06265 [Candidatus Roizmanbacteria bacterium]|nr:MAG: hypothetical protein IPM65_06265 [Candidatus Roizmanbacteria bacterium]
MLLSLFVLANTGSVYAQEPTATERTLYMPLISTALAAPQQQGEGEGKWYQGVIIHTEWYDFQPHYTLQIGVPDPGSYMCRELVMWNIVKKQYIAVTDGHWRDYPDNPDVWGPEFWQVTKSWIAAHLIEALRPGYYWAWCTDGT